MLKKASFPLLFVFFVGAALFFKDLSPETGFHQNYVHFIFLLFILSFLFKKVELEITLGASLVVVTLLKGLFFNALFECFIFLIPMALSYLIIKIFRDFLERDSEFISTQKRKVEEKIQLLKDRLENKTLTLENIEKQVADIIDLFEVAKKFNECLNVADILDILKINISKSLTYDAISLILIDDSYPSNVLLDAYRIDSERKVNKFDPDSKEEEHQADYKQMQKFVNFCKENKDIIRIDYPAQINDVFGSEFKPRKLPLWIFPLVVEHKLIGVFIIEGPKTNEFAKYSIIASQLALQIKKVRLYLAVKELSITDGLTKVFLRRHFTERFQEELRRSLKYQYDLCVLMVDIDHFKDYNDNYGHLVGNVTLKEVANVIKESVRRVDLVGRFGGEEFVVVLPETSKAGGCDAAERIRSAVAKKKLLVYDVETKVTLSIGLSTLREDLPDYEKMSEEKISEELLGLADQCLYQAKEDGRNRVKWLSK